MYENLNTILIDEYEKKIENFNGILLSNHTSIHMHLYGNNHISKIQMPNKSDIRIDLEDNATLNLNLSFDENIETIKMIINSKNQTTLNCRFNIETEKDFKMEFENNVIGNQNKSNICIHAISKHDAKMKIKTIGRIKKNTLDNEFLEELKGLTLKQESITFIPELIIDSDSVIANHNATIKNIDQEELFYLQSKGISKEQSIELIKNGFLNKYEK